MNVPNSFSKHGFSKKKLASCITLAIVMTLQGCVGGSSDTVAQCEIEKEAYLTTQSKIGGSTTNALVFDFAGQDYAIYNIANALKVTPVAASTISSTASTLEVPGYIKSVKLIENYADTGTRYAIISMGSEGIAVVDLTDPANMQLVSVTAVNYAQDGITWTEGGGAIIPDNSISGTRASITAVEVYTSTDEVTEETTDYLIIADEDFGLHKTLLSNLLAESGPVVEDDGTLKVDSEVYTLQYAGENPWGGPLSVKLYDNRLFVTLGYLGMGIFDPDTLEQVGRYNLFTDASVVEDWYIDMDIADTVQPGFVDAFTGMPDYNQASFEIQEVWKGDTVAETPWADYDRYGREYYKATTLDVATVNGKTIAYIAYGLGGLIAVDVTGYDTAAPYNPEAASPFADFLTATYLGYAPAVPANGPDTPTSISSQSLFPHSGSGMLKEAGVIDIKVQVNDSGTAAQAYYTDHFAGLVVMGGAEDPTANWKQGTGGYDNDDPALGDGVLGDHWPDYEFVTSYDMSGADEHETLPAWMSAASINLLSTGEISGHGNALALIPSLDPTGDGVIDVVLASGAGGLSFMEILDLNSATPSAESFTIASHLATTDEVGADVNGEPMRDLSIGHTEGVDALDQYLFVGDGPHGMSVWKIADENCNPLDEVHLVANTLQDEYPETSTSGATVYPAPHAFDVVLDAAQEVVYVLAQSLGLRRIGTDDVVAGTGEVGSPLLIAPTYPDDIFEHNLESGNVTDYIRRQDHAYDVAIKGNYAFVADGSNGLTVYDTSVVPDDIGSHIVSSLGAAKENPLLGRATAVKLWTDPETDTEYAFVAAGHSGLAVVDVSNVGDSTIDPTEQMTLVKIFEPIKIEDGKVGHADGRSVDLLILDDHVYFSYDSFGIVAYSIADMIAPLADGIDPTDLWRKTADSIDHRPEATFRLKIGDALLGGLEELSEFGGGALGMDAIQVDGKTFIYATYGEAGVVKIDWTDPAAPVILEHANTVGEAMDITVENGRVYVADNMGGITLLH